MQKRSAENSVPSGYYLARFRDSKIIALDSGAGPGVFRAALKRYQPDTVKRALFRRWLGAARVFRLPRVWERVSHGELARIAGFDLDEWLKRVSETVKEPNLLPVVIWPPESSRKRIYVHLLNGDGDALGFAKIAFDAENSEQLQAECETLVALARDNAESFHVPFVIEHGVFDGNRFLIIEPIPDTAKTHRSSDIGFPCEAVKKYAGPIQMVSFDQLQEQGWWNRFAKTTDAGSGFMNDLHRIAADERIGLCRIHGDMGPSNLLQDNGELWIIDWEESRGDGPCLTDSVSFYLALNRKRVMRKPHEALRQMIAEFSDSVPEANTVDVMMGLAFLHSVKFTLASTLIDVWPEKGSTVFDSGN